MVSTVAVHGNTSAASVPLALMTAVEDGRIKRGDLVLLEAMGGGLHLGRRAWSAGNHAFTARRSIPLTLTG